MLVSVGDTGFEHLPHAHMTDLLFSHYGSSSYYPYARMLCINHAHRRSRMFDPDEVEDDKEELRSLDEED